MAPAPTISVEASTWTNGESSIRRLYAVAECTRTGLHGGNRLASNSLIEAVAYADAAARHASGTHQRLPLARRRARMERRGTPTPRRWYSSHRAREEGTR